MPYPDGWDWDGKADFSYLGSSALEGRAVWVTSCALEPAQSAPSRSQCMWWLPPLPPLQVNQTVAKGIPSRTATSCNEGV